VLGSLRWATAATALLLLLVLSADLLNVAPFAPSAPKAALPAPALQKMVVETVVVEKKAEEKAAPPPSAKSAATHVAPATRARAENELELATAPEAVERPESVEKRGSQSTAVLEAPRPQAALPPSGEGEEQTLLASPAERNILSLDPLRLLEITLAGLLVVLIGLLFWARWRVREM